MKRKIGLASLILIIVVVIFVKYFISDGISTSSKLKEEVTASYGINVDSLKYDGDIISANVIYNNGPIDCEVGIIIFVNGISQPYYTDKHEEAYLIPYKLTKNTNKTIKINFKPKVGAKDKKLSIEIGSMLNPSYTSDKFYGNNQKVFFLEPYTLTCKNDSNNNIVFFDDFKLNRIKEESKNNLNFNVLQGNKVVNKIKINNNRLICTISLYGKEEQYILSAYINHKIVPLFSGLYYAKIDSTKENTSTIPIDFNISGVNLNKYNSFYIIAIPTKSNDRANKIDTILIEK